MWYKNHLQLIATVDVNYEHIVELEALINMIETSERHYGVSEEQWQRLIMLARNTYSIHYENSITETVHTELKTYKPIY